MYVLGFSHPKDILGLQGLQLCCGNAVILSLKSP